METWFLVIVLTLPASNEEQHVAVVMPDEETCNELRDTYVYAVNIRKPIDMSDPDTGFVDPFVEFQDDVRTEIAIDEVRCEVGAEPAK